MNAPKVNKPKGHANNNHDNKNVIKPTIAQLSAENKDKEPTWEQQNVQLSTNAFGEPVILPPRKPIQTKLNVGTPGDKFETEADNVADTVVQRAETPSVDAGAAPPIQTSKVNSGDLQRMEDENDVQMESEVQKEEEEEVQMETEEEVQMEAVADEDVQMESSEDSSESEEVQLSKQDFSKREAETSDVQMKPEPVTVQPVASSEAEEEVQMEEEEKEEEEVQLKQKVKIQAASDENTNSGASIASRLQSSKGGGNKMDETTKSEMESGFGHDLSNVNIHTDSNAIQMNKELGAKAFTNGSDIYFNEGNYNPQSKDGKHLLAHELTHTLQQGEGNGMMQMELEDPEKRKNFLPIVPARKGLANKNVTLQEYPNDEMFEYIGFRCKLNQIFFLLYESTDKKWFYVETPGPVIGKGYLLQKDVSESLELLPEANREEWTFGDLEWLKEQFDFYVETGYYFNLTLYLQKNHEFLDFVRRKSAGTGVEAIRAAKLLKLANREAFIEDHQIIYKLAEDLAYIKEEVASFMTNPHVPEKHQRFMDDIDWMIINLEEEKFSLKSLETITYNVTVFLGLLGTMRQTFESVRQTLSSEGQNKAKQVTLNNLWTMEDAMYGLLQVLSRNTESIFFAEPPSRLVWSNATFWYSFNMGFARAADTDATYLSLLRYINETSTAISKEEAPDELSKFVSEQGEELGNLWLQGTGAFTEEQYKVVAAKVEHISIVMSTVGIALSTFLMRKLISDGYRPPWDVSTDERDKAKKTFTTVYDALLDLLKSSRNNPGALNEGVGSIMNTHQGDYYEATQVYNYYRNWKENLDAMKEAAIEIGLFLLEVAITVGSIGAGLAARAVTKELIKYTVGELFVTEVSLLAGEAAGFTYANRQLQEVVQYMQTGEAGLSTSFREDFEKNFLMFGVLKGTAAGYERLFTTSKTLRSQAGLFIVELGALTGFEAAYTAWENRLLPPEQQNELFSWQTLGRSAMFLLTLKSVLALTSYKFNFLAPYTFKSYNENINNLVLNTRKKLETQKSRKGIETTSEAKELTQTLNDLVETIKTALESAKTSEKISEKDLSVIEDMLPMLDKFIAENDKQIRISNKYNLEYTDSGNVLSFEVRSSEELKEFKDDITRIKTAKGFEITGNFYRAGGNLYIYKPNNSGIAIYLRKKATIQLKQPTLYDVSAEVFAGKTKGMQPHKYAQKQFAEAYKKAGGRMDADIPYSKAYNDIIVDAIKRGWTGGSWESLPPESVRMAEIHFREVRSKWLDEQIETLSLTPPQKPTLNFMKYFMTSKQNKMLVEKVGLIPEKFGKYSDMIIGRITRPTDIINVEIKESYIEVELPEGTQALIEGADLIGNKLNNHLKENADLARLFNESLEPLDIANRHLLRQRVEKSIGDGSTEAVITKTNYLLNRFPEAQSEFVPILSKINKVEVYDQYINNLALLPENSSLTELRLSVTRTGKTDALPAEKEIKSERPGTFREKNNLNRATSLPYANQFANGTFYFHPDLNYAIRARIEKGENPLYTREYFEGLHAKYGKQGILYNENGLPDLSLIALREKGGEISGDNSGTIIRVNLADVVEMESLGLEKKIEGLTPIKGEHKGDSHYIASKLDNLQAERAEKVDVKHANLIMKKRWKKLGYGKWEQPEGSVWYFEPHTHEMILVRAEELSILGYVGEKRYTDIVRSPEFVKSAPDVVEAEKVGGELINVGSATQKQLEDVYYNLSKDPPNKYTPNTIEHKADRWMQYKARMGESAKTYETWSKIYNSNMTKAIEAHKAADEVMKSIGWGEREVTVQAGTYTRRMDIADIKIKKGVEVKAYESGKVYATESIRGELGADRFLIDNEFWEIEWLFKGCQPSGPLEILLEKANITVTIIP